MVAEKTNEIILQFFVGLVKKYGWKKIWSGLLLVFKFVVWPVFFCLIWSYGMLAFMLEIIRGVGFGKTSTIPGSHADSLKFKHGDSRWFEGIIEIYFLKVEENVRFRMISTNSIFFSGIFIKMVFIVRCVSSRFAQWY